MTDQLGVTHLSGPQPFSHVRASAIARLQNWSMSWAERSWASARRVQSRIVVWVQKSTSAATTRWVNYKAWDACHGTPAVAGTFSPPASDYPFMPLIYDPTIRVVLAAQFLLQAARQGFKLLQGHGPQVLLFADGDIQYRLKRADQFDLFAFDLAFDFAFDLAFDLAILEDGVSFPLPVANRSLSCIVHGFVLGNLGNPRQSLRRLSNGRLRQQFRQCRGLILFGMQEPV